METRISTKNTYYPPGGILMWIIIFLELLTFGLALIAMSFYAYEEPELFHNSRLMLNPTYGTINTFFLIVSGFFMAVSVHYLKEKNVTKTALYLKLTMLGGLLFLVLKSIEYYFKIDAGLGISYNTFFTFYWMLTLFHVVHVITGLVILWVIYFDLKKKKEETNLEDFEASATFWHMCDLIWILLFPVIYLIF